MAVEQLLLTQFRHFDRCHFTFKKSGGVIVGSNGSGKTSLLESIYYLAYAKSFRCHANRVLISHQHERFQIDAKITQGANSCSVQSIYGHEKNSQSLSLDHQKGTKQSEIAKMLPVVFIDASTHREFANTPKNRRDFLNWCCFYTVSDYHVNLGRYQRALQQRNHLLKQCKQHASHARLLDTWTEPLIFYAEKVHEARLQLLETLNANMAHIWPHFFAKAPGYLRYTSGWRDKTNFADCLQQSVQQDILYGFTQHGPHRADIACLTGDQLPLFQSFSQGQQKLFAYIIKFLQLALIETSQAQESILLIDDLTAELDSSNQSKVLAYLKDLPCQQFLTALDLNAFRDYHADQAIMIDQLPEPVDDFSPRMVLPV